MINIYIGKENLPEGMDIIFDPDKALLAVPITGTDFQKLIIKEVDKGEYLDDSFFIDRFGGRSYLTSLSTGAKAMLELEAFPNSAVCCDGVGNNAFKYISHLTNCNAYFSKRMRGWEEFDLDVPVYLNGDFYESIDAINSAV